jgi:hypothetical protein
MLRVSTPSLGSMSIGFPFYFHPFFWSLSEARMGPVLTMVLRNYFFFFLTRFRIHNASDGYCGCSPSVPLLRTETEDGGIEEHSRQLWHFCRYHFLRCCSTHRARARVPLMYHTAHVYSRQPGRRRR